MVEKVDKELVLKAQRLEPDDLLEEEPILEPLSLQHGGDVQDVVGGLHGQWH